MRNKKNIETLGWDMPEDSNNMEKNVKAAAKPKYSQSKVFEFNPNNSISTEEVLELVGLIRIGVSGDTLSKASENLKKYFKEIK